MATGLGWLVVAWWSSIGGAEALQDKRKGHLIFHGTVFNLACIAAAYCFFTAGAG